MGAVAVRASRPSDLLLSPVLARQGARVRRETLVLPEAGGAREGEAGAGRRLDVVVVGESTAASVGVAEQRDGLAAQLAAELAEGTGRLVRWRVAARSACRCRRAGWPQPVRPARRPLEPARPAGPAGEEPLPVRPSPTPEPAVDAVDGAVQVPGLKAGARRMLDTLARHHPVRVTRAQLATLSRFKVTGGTFSTYYSTLRRAGLITEFDGLIGLSDAGRAQTGVTAAGAPASTQELLGQWRSALKAGAPGHAGPARAGLPPPDALEELAAAAGYQLAGGTYNAYLSTLRRNGLVAVDGDKVRAAEVLFLTGQPGSRR